MRTPIAAIVATIAFASCESYPSGFGRASSTGYWSHAYDIAGGGAREAAQVKQIVRTIAAQANLQKRTASPHDFSPLPFVLYGDSRVRLLGMREKDYVRVDVIRYDFSGAAAFARLDGLVRSTLLRRYGGRLHAESEPDYSHEIITY